MNWRLLTVGAVVFTITYVLSWSKLAAATKAKPKLKIDRVVCIDMQDTGANGKADEPYLEINGNIVWSRKIARGDIKDLDLEIPFNSSMARIDLWERDGENFHGSNDDYLGGTKIYVTQAGFGRQKLVFRDRAKSYHYEIYYQVQ